MSRLSCSAHSLQTSNSSYMPEVGISGDTASLFLIIHPQCVQRIIRAVWASFLIVVVRVMLECGMRVTAEHIDASFDSDACGVPISTLVAFFFYVVFVT